MPGIGLCRMSVSSFEGKLETREEQPFWECCVTDTLDGTEQGTHSVTNALELNNIQDANELAREAHLPTLFHSYFVGFLNFTHILWV